MGGISYRNKNEGKLDRYGKKKKPNWEYRFYVAPVDGKSKRVEKSGYERKQDAVEAATIAYAEYMSSGEVSKPSMLSYADVLDKWMEDYCAIECNDVTRLNYEKKIRLHIKPKIGQYRVTAITTEVIQRLINSMVKDKYSRNTISVVKSIISKSLKYAKRMKWVRYNESTDVELPSLSASKGLRSKERVALPREKIAEIFRRFPEGHSCYIPLLMGYKGGTRIGEAFAFEWEDVDFEAGTIDINKQVQWYKEKQAWKILPPKYESYRNIDMDKQTMSYLKKEKQLQIQMRLAYGPKYTRLYRDEEGFINTDGRGEEIFMVTVRADGTYIHPRVMQNCSRAVHAELNCPEFDFHTLRHTHATELAEAGVDMKEIQRRLGHKSLQVTDKRYIHATQRMREDAMVILEALYQA